MNIVGRLQEVFSTKPRSSLFTGDFKSWHDAKECSTGYDAPQILAKTRAALLQVKEGKAAFERDSVAFDKIEPNFSLLSGLSRAAAVDEGRLNVLDFGGSLGGTYFQCRNSLPLISEFRWNVIDQPAQVACGKADFANEELHFYESIDHCLREQKPNVLLLSGVLQYLPEPYIFLEDILRKEIPHVIVERTAFNADGVDRLTVQHVPAWLYDASYPAWFLSEASLRRIFAPKHDLICEYPGGDEAELEGGKAVFKGFQFQRKSS